MRIHMCRDTLCEGRWCWVDPLVCHASDVVYIRSTENWGPRYKESGTAPGMACMFASMCSYLHVYVHARMCMCERAITWLPLHRHTHMGRIAHTHHTHASHARTHCIARIASRARTDVCQYQCYPSAMTHVAATHSPGSRNKFLPRSKGKCSRLAFLKAWPVCTLRRRVGTPVSSQRF